MKKNNNSSRWEAPDVFLLCERCESEWMIVLPRDPNHAYYRAHRATGQWMCPQCIHECFDEDTSVDGRTE